MRETRKLDKLINYMLDGKTIQINKIETNKHVWVAKLPPLEKLTAVEPETTLRNVIANMALLNTGSFHLKGDEVVARFKESDKNTLIITEWYFPRNAFDSMVHTLTYGDTAFKVEFNKINDRLPPNYRVIIESKFYTSKYEQI